MGHLSFYNKNQIRDKLLLVLIFLLYRKDYVTLKCEIHYSYRAKSSSWRSHCGRNDGYRTNKSDQSVAVAEVPEHTEGTTMQSADNGQEENMHVVEDIVG